MNSNIRLQSITQSEENHLFLPGDEEKRVFKDIMSCCNYKVTSTERVVGNKLKSKCMFH